MTNEQLEKLETELRLDIVKFIKLVEPELLKEIDNNQTTILGIKRSGVPNPFSSYLYAKLQQEARECPEYSILADAMYQTVDPSQRNSLKTEILSKRIVIGVEESYEASTHAYLQRLVEFDPLSIFYAIAKEPRLVTVYKPESKSSV